jgi:hypothetical protein
LEGGEFVELEECLLPVWEITARQFPDYQRMRAELVIPDQSCQLCFESSPPKHLNPDGSVDEDQGSFTRRLRTSLIFGAVPALRRYRVKRVVKRANRQDAHLLVTVVMAKIKSLRPVFNPAGSLAS